MRLDTCDSPILQVTLSCTARSIETLVPAGDNYTSKRSEDPTVISKTGVPKGGQVGPEVKQDPCLAHGSRPVVSLRSGLTRCNPKTVNLFGPTRPLVGVPVDRRSRKSSLEHRVHGNRQNQTARAPSKSCSGFKTGRTMDSLFVRMSTSVGHVI